MQRPPVDEGTPIVHPEISQGLARRFFVGGLYLGLGSWLTSAANFAIGIALARILGPETFGFYALVYAIDQLLNTVGAFSIQFAIVQQVHESDRLYDTGLAILALLGGIGLVLALAVAPVLGHLRSSQAALFLVILGFARLLMLVGQAPMAQLERHLRFGLLATINSMSLNIPNLCALVLAWYGAGAWSLVAKDSLTPTLAAIFAFALSGYRFRGRVDREMASQLMSFGRPMLLTRGFEIGLERLDRLFVGAWLGDRPLGLYNQARILAETTWVAARPLFSLSFNLYSRLQGEPARLARACAIVNYFLVRGVCVVAAVLLIYPQETIRLLLGPAWVGAAPTLRCLALYSVILPPLENLKNLLLGQGAVWEATKLRLIQVAALGPAALIAVLLGRIEWVAGSLVLAGVVGLALAGHYTRSLMEGGLRKVFALPLLCLMVTAMLFALAPGSLAAKVPYWFLPVFPAVTYGAVLVVLERRVLVIELRYLHRVLTQAG